MRIYESSAYIEHNVTCDKKKNLMCYFIVAPIPVAVMRFDIFKFRIFPILLAPRPVSWSNYYYGYGYAPSNTIHKAGIRSARPKISAYGTHGYRGYRRV